MSILNTDLINCCRVCQSPNQDADYECLYKFTDNQHPPKLTDAGILFQSLFNISLKKHHYPQFLCNSCDLQIKLFKKLKDKAYKTLEYLEKLYEVNNEDIQPNIEQDYVFQECKENFHGAYQRNRVIHQEETPNECQENMFEYDADEYDKDDTVYNGDCEENLNSESLHDEDKALNAKTGEIEELGINIDYLNNEYKIKVESIEDTKGNPLTPDRLDQYIDKNDYVTEIYELLDDEDKIDNIYAEKYETIEFDVFAQEETEASSAWSDVEYVVEEEIYDDDDKSEQYITKKISSTTASEKRKRIYKCAICKLEFTNSKEHKKHRIDVHNTNHICNICSKEFKSLASLHHHMKMHSDQPAYQCEICPKTFNQRAHYQYHMNHHNNVRNFKCNVCEKAFLSSADLKVHRRSHTGHRPYVCHICGKDYLMAEHLKTHFLTHTDQNFQCDICNRNFATHKTLRLHVRTIHEEEPRFKCTFCSKPFRRKHHLQYHLKVHEKNNRHTDSNYEMLDDRDVDDANCNSVIVEEDQIPMQYQEFIALDDEIV